MTRPGATLKSQLLTNQIKDIVLNRCFPTPLGATIMMASSGGRGFWLYDTTIVTFSGGVTNHGGHQRKRDLAIRKRIKKTWANHGGHQPEDLCSMFETATSPPHERKRDQAIKRERRKSDQSWWPSARRSVLNVWSRLFSTPWEKKVS